MDLKIKDVADLLNVSETTIRRWLTDGKIPAYKINHQYRFSRIEIEDWVLSQKIAHHVEYDFQSAREKTLQPLAEKSTHAGRKQFSLYRAIHKGKVFHDLEGNSKEEIIRETMQKLAVDLNLDPDVITELLLDRENLQPTALNNGIGIPHTRDCLLAPGQNVVAVVFPKKPIPYGALDGKPVHTLFFLFAGDDKRHLHLLAKIAHLTSKASTLDLLRKKPSKVELLQSIKDWEASIQKAVECEE